MQTAAQICNSASLPSASLMAHGGRNLFSGVWDSWTDWGLQSAAHYMRSFPHLAQDNKSKLQKPDEESHGSVKSGHRHRSRRKAKKMPVFFAMLWNASLRGPRGPAFRQFPDKGGPAWPKTTCIPERFSGQRWLSDPGDGQEKLRGPSGVQGWAPGSDKPAAAHFLAAAWGTLGTLM